MWNVEKLQVVLTSGSVLVLQQFFPFSLWAPLPRWPSSRMSETVTLYVIPSVSKDVASISLSFLSFLSLCTFLRRV